TRGDRATACKRGGGQRSPSPRAVTARPPAARGDLLARGSKSSLYTNEFWGGGGACRRQREAARRDCCWARRRAPRRSVSLDCAPAAWQLRGAPGRGSQAVRQRFAKPSHAGSNPVLASNDAQCFPRRKHWVFAVRGFGDGTYRDAAGRCAPPAWVIAG